MKKPTLNLSDIGLVLITTMVALALHQKFVAAKLAPKSKA